MKLFVFVFVFLMAGFHTNEGYLVVMWSSTKLKRTYTWQYIIHISVYLSNTNKQGQIKHYNTRTCVILARCNFGYETRTWLHLVVQIHCLSNQYMFAPFSTSNRIRLFVYPYMYACYSASNRIRLFDKPVHVCTLQY